MMQSKVALVTGSAKGLGKAFSEALLKRGARVCISDIDEKEGQKTKDEFKNSFGSDVVMFEHCDTTSETDMERTFSNVVSRFGQLDLVVNNAGIMNEKRWQKMIDINVNGVIRGTMLGLKCMGQDQGGRGGHIINVASAAGITPVPFMPSYAASKHAVVAYTRSLALNPFYQQHRVRINCLCPFFTNTDIMKVEDGAVVGSALAEATFAGVGVMSVSDVAKAFEVYLDDNVLNGAVLKVTVKGHSFVKFPKTGFEELNNNVTSKL